MDLVYLKSAIVMYKSYYKLLPFNVQNVFVEVQSVHKYSTRQKFNLHVQHVNTSMRKHSISCIGVQIWNELNDVLKRKKSLASFRLSLKKQLILSIKCFLQPNLLTSHLLLNYFHLNSQYILYICTVAIYPILIK